MMIKEEFLQDGFQIINGIFDTAELTEINAILKQKKIEQKMKKDAG